MSTLVLAGLLASCAKDREYEEKYKAPEITGKNAINTAAEYLYVPTSLGVPRFTDGLAPFVQGRERVVKLKFEKDGIVAYSMEADARFQDNEANNQPIIKIPVSYKSYRCAENSNDECTNKEEENTELEWHQKDKFVPDFEGAKVLEADAQGLLPNSNDPCISEQDTRLVNYKITDKDINFELEKKYKYSTSGACMNKFYAGATSWDDVQDKLDDNGSFKTRIAYSFAKLDTITTPDYKVVDYPVIEHGLFGFFKTSEKYKNASNQKDRRYKLNRWNAKDGVIEYHLSDEFNKPSNAYLKEATIFAFERMNEVLAMNGVNLKLKLNMPSNKSVGDLRNSMIVLVEDIASGLLGYGPTVANPRTGEIVKGHVNMYKGSLESFAPYTYDSIVFLEQELKRAQNAKPLPAPPAQDQNDADTAANDQGPQSQDERRAELTQDMIAVFNAMKDQVDHGDHSHGHDHGSHSSLTDIDFSSSAPSKKKLEEIKNRKFEVKVADRLLKKFKETNNQYYKELADKSKQRDLLHENSVFTADMLNFQSLGKASVKDINKVSGIRDNEGNLLPWIELSDDKKLELKQILARHAYIPTLVHEVGHNLGLRHNFQGSVDKANFYNEEERKKLGIEGGSVYSSIMDYAYSSLNELSTFGKYDIAALKFAYNREVELNDGSFVKIDKTDKNGKRVKLDLDQVPGLKRYSFCTDENAGSSLTCNRFDEGTNELEIMRHYTDKYKERYYWNNVKGNSKRFNDGSQEWRYAVSKFYAMHDVRNIHEQWQSFHTYLSGFAGYGHLTLTGCTDQDRAQIGDFCDTVERINMANEEAGRFYLDIIKTPDLICDTEISATLQGRDYLPAQRIPFNLSQFIDDMEFPLPNGVGSYKPHTCFDKNVEGVLAKQIKPQIVRMCTQSGGDQMLCDAAINVKAEVIGESGKLHNNVDAAYRRDEKRYTGDLEIRGNWIDKAWAMEFLVNKDLMTTAGAKLHLSFVDHPKFRAEIDNLMKHLTYGAPLENPNMFIAKSGLEYPAPYEVNVNTETKVPRLKWLLGQFIPFPDSEDFKIGPVLVKLAAKNTFSSSSDSQTVEEYLQRSEFHDSIQVVGKNNTTSSIDFGSDIVDSIEIGKATYAATERNTLALDLINKLKGGLESKANEIGAIKDQLDQAQLDAQAQAQAQAQQDAQGDDQAAPAQTDQAPAQAAEPTAGIELIKKVIANKRAYLLAKKDTDAILEVLAGATQDTLQAKLDELANKIGVVRFNRAVTVFQGSFGQPSSNEEAALRTFDLFELEYFMKDGAKRAVVLKDLKNGLFNMP